MATLFLTLTFTSSVFSVAVAVTARLFHIDLKTMMFSTALFVLGIDLDLIIWGLRTLYLFWLAKLLFILNLCFTAA